MSMKYYAVTDDPNELLHYGVKGMKWGQHIFGDKPKSSGYKRALGKLRNSAKSKVGKARSTLKSSSAQFSMNRQKKQQDKYNRAVEKAQQRASIVSEMVSADHDRKMFNDAYRDLMRQQKVAKSMAKIERYQKDAAVGSLASQARQARRAVKVDKNFDRVLQKARKGKLKFGNLSEDQIARMQERLSSEANARKLGAAEKTWHQQKKEARRAGKLKGIETGTAAAMTEIARAGAQFGVQHAIDRMMMRSAAKQEGKRNRIKTRAQNKRTHRDINRQVREEAFEARVRDGEGIIKRNNPFYIREEGIVPVGFKPRFTTKSAANYLNTKNESKSIKDEQKRIREKNEKITDDIYKTLATSNARALIAGTKDLATVEKEHKQIYDMMYGNQNTSTTPAQKTKYSRITGAPVNGTTISRMANRMVNPSNTNFSVSQWLSRASVSPITNTLNLNTSGSIVGRITGRKRKPKGNPLKG